MPSNIETLINFINSNKPNLHDWKVILHPYTFDPYLSCKDCCAAAFNKKDFDYHESGKEDCRVNYAKTT